MTLRPRLLASNACLCTTDNTRSLDLFDMIDYEIKTIKPKDIL